MKKITLYVHSFVDLITNSSTEIYIAATESTIEGIKNIINNILSLGGSKFTADDLFEFSLPEKTEEDEDSWGDDYYQSVDLIVKAKDETSELAKDTAKAIADITGIFSINACHNG
jgi:hypothetical protein